MSVCQSSEVVFVYCVNCDDFENQNNHAVTAQHCIMISIQIPIMERRSTIRRDNSSAYTGKTKLLYRLRKFSAQQPTESSETREYDTQLLFT